MSQNMMKQIGLFMKPDVYKNSVNALKRSNRTGNIRILAPIKEDGELFRPTTGQIIDHKTAIKSEKARLKT